MRGWGLEGLGSRETMIPTAPDVGQPEAVAQELGAEFCTDQTVPRPATGAVSGTYCGAGAAFLWRLAREAEGFSLD